MLDIAQQVYMNASDHRRAYSMFSHIGNQNFDGICAVVEEAKETGRTTALCLAILDLHEKVIKVLHTNDAMACWSVLIYDLIHDEDTDPHLRLASRLITAYAEKDSDTFNDILGEANELRCGTDMLVAIHSVFATTCPIMYSRLGVEVVGRAVYDWAAKEAE